MQKVAIIGTGIAGMGCAHWIHQKFAVTLFEQNNYVGGHTNTICVDEDGSPIFMDTGFMVFNYKTYPNLCSLFEEIQAPVKKTSMSFSVQHCPSNLEYCGSGLNGLFAQRKNILRPSFLKMLLSINRFNKEALKILDDPNFQNHTLGEFVHDYGFGEEMLWKYIVPMSAAVWSTPMEKVLDFPAVTLIRFFKNHGFLGMNTQHQWFTLEMGSQSYREKLIAPFKDKIKISVSVDKVERREYSALVHTSEGEIIEFDKVIFACHADQALRLLKDPTPLESVLLSCFQYQYNPALVHTDESVMPKNKKVWSSWNYRIENRNGQNLATTIYWMNSLQQVSTKKNYFVSINAIPGSIDPKKVLRQIDYEHPLFDLNAIKAQNDLNKLNKYGPLYYCGSYFKYGFHEDAYTSALELSKMLLNE